MVKSVLFICNQNSVRSPMAAALLQHAAGDRIRIDSAGVYEGAPDPFLQSILKEIGVELDIGDPKGIEDLAPATFDLIVALTLEAQKAAETIAPPLQIEFWPTRNPSEAYGSREQIMGGYRDVRDDILGRLKERFPEIYQNA